MQLSSFVVVVIVIFSFNNNCINAECCTDFIRVHYACGVGWCKESICKDGTYKRTSFCGYDSCNIFGCNCTCRDNSLGTWDEARRIHYSENSHLKFL